MEEKKKLSTALENISRDLDRTVEFWTKHSHDDKYGGFFVCLNKDGEVFDDTKYGWLQSRQVWTYARLYNEIERFHREDILTAATKGAEFLLEFVRNPENNRCYFLVTRDGRPIKYQRTIFTECFYVMAMSEMARATGQDKYKVEAVTIWKSILHWVYEDDTLIEGSTRLSGVEKMSSQAVPMMLLCVYNQLVDMDTQMMDTYRDVADKAIAEILLHVQREGTVILENVSPEGYELPGSTGRLTTPGHAIEAGWFLLHLAARLDRPDLKKIAIDKFMLTSFEKGWDKEYGGLFYFLDIDGYSPVQLEWNMKLWWPHNEAMIAFLLAYKETRDADLLDKFFVVYEYSYKHFVDDVNGEWFGYLHRNGEVSADFKAGPWKGCFHVPRCLMMCETIIKQLLNE